MVFLLRGIVLNKECVGTHKKRGGLKDGFMFREVLRSLRI